MDPTPLIVSGSLVAITVITRRPISADLRPRVLVELAVMVAAGIGGMIVGGSSGDLIAIVGLLPSLAMVAARRRVQRLMSLERGPQLRQAITVLDVLSWPVPDQAFNVSAHLGFTSLVEDPKMAEDFLQRPRRRPTTTLQLALAQRRGDRAKAAELALRLMREPHNAEEQFDGFRSLLSIDLPTALQWYTSPQATRMRKRGGVSVDLQILIAAGRVEPAMLLANRLSISELERDVVGARARLGRGDVEGARALMMRHGSRGQAMFERYQRWSAGQQALSAEGNAVVDEIAARAAGQATTIGRDTGRWRPVMTWILGAVLIVSYLRQTNDGGFTSQALYDQGAFLTGPYREWSRSLSAPYLHASAAHLVFNLIGLLVIGRLVESRITKWQYVVAWLLTSTGSFIVIGFVQTDTQLGVGASGGVLGLLGVGLAVIGMQLKRHRTEALLSAFKVLVFITAFQLVADHLVPNVAWVGHLSGLAIGCLLGVAFAARQQATSAAT